MPTYVAINNNQLNYLYTENKNTYLPPDHLLCSRTLLQVLHLLVNPYKPMPYILLLYRWEKRIQERGDYKLLIQTWLSSSCLYLITTLLLVNRGTLGNDWKCRKGTEFVGLGIPKFGFYSTDGGSRWGIFFFLMWTMF